MGCYRFDTKCIHIDNGIDRKKIFGSVSMPIFQTATFAHPALNESTGYDYTRVLNPTREELEKHISALEDAHDTIACSNGMNAVLLTMHLFENGDEIICSRDLYGGSVRLFDRLKKEKKLVFHYADTTDPDNVLKLINKKTKALYVETPSNPTMDVTDLKKIGEISRDNNLVLIVDNTFLTPYLQNPLKLGADIVIHSGSKFLSGHNDTLAGFVSSSSPKLSEELRSIFKTYGYSLSPFDSFLLLRGIKTLSVRVERQQKNAMKIAKWLKTHEKIKEVIYVGLKEHPGYEINLQQARGAGSIISFKTDNAGTAKKLIENIKLVVYAESLGGTESLLTCPVYQTHADLDEYKRKELGISEEFIRLSVGLEDYKDIIQDINQALM